MSNKTVADICSIINEMKRTPNWRDKGDHLAAPCQLGHASTTGTLFDLPSDRPLTELQTDLPDGFRAYKVAATEIGPTLKAISLRKAAELGVRPTVTNKLGTCHLEGGSMNQSPSNVCIITRDVGGSEIVDSWCPGDEPLIEASPHTLVE